MNDLHWAVFALRDIKNALDCEKYEIAAYHIDDAINAILAINEETSECSAASQTGQERPVSQRL